MVTCGILQYPAVSCGNKSDRTPNGHILITFLTRVKDVSTKHVFKTCVEDVSVTPKALQIGDIHYGDFSLMISEARRDSVPVINLLTMFGKMTC